MMRHRMFGIVAIVVALDAGRGCARAAALARRAGDGTRPAGAKASRSTSSYCVGCHGANGDGKGPAADMLIVKPRDFTKGIFKFRSTPSGTLPTDEDLYTHHQPRRVPHLDARRGRCCPSASAWR